MAAMPKQAATEALFAAALEAPPRADWLAYDHYQAAVMAPLRKQLADA